LSDDTTAIIHGERGITDETALLFGRAFATTSRSWLNLQTRYELDVANRKVVGRDAASTNFPAS